MQRKAESIAVSGHRSAEIRELPDCIHLAENGRCTQLNLPFCRGEKCSFMTTAVQQQNEREKWANRLSHLSEDEQKGIARKYYGGTMPWKE